MAILNRLRANPWVVALLSLVIMLILVLSWTTTAHAQSDTPFDAQYTLLGITDDPGDSGHDSGQASRTSTGDGQGGGNAFLALLPSTGGPQLWLAVLGSSALCFGSVLLMQRLRNRRR